MCTSVWMHQTLFYIHVDFGDFGDIAPLTLS